MGQHPSLNDLGFRAQGFGLLGFRPIMFSVAFTTYGFRPRRPVTAQKLRPRLSPCLVALAVFGAHSNAWKHAKCWHRQQFCVSERLDAGGYFCLFSSTSTPFDMLEILLLSPFRWREHPCVTRASMVKP